MIDTKKSEEAARKIADLKRVILGYESNIARFEQEKNNKIRSLDQQIKSERDKITQLNRQVDDLKRQL
jgi:predicted  nucleic acid-binding Zn-ribbon protein